MSNEDNLEINSDKQISDYILTDEIGCGGFAKVVKGIHIPTGEKVAIKVMDKIQLFTDPLNLRRVKTEISILKLVRHKNIIKLYEVIETPKKIYLIMEYCEGGELFDYIVKKQHLTERQSCAFFHEIIDALEYLHSLNIVHRDLKPENLLLDKINKKFSLKLIDFGISNTYTMQSLLVTPCGTASYAPPEMHKGEKYYGLLTDIWSAGVVLYAMVFGYLPFCDDDEDININNIIEGNYEIPSSASPELYDLLLHLLDINPITRYDLDQIKIHPWYNFINNDNNKPGLIVGYHKIPVDQRIINICESYGYDTNKVRESVINNNYDNNSSIYYIILNKMKTMGIESISDLNSNEYLNYISDPSNIVFNPKYSSCKSHNTTEDDTLKNYITNNFESNNINTQITHSIETNLTYENITPSINIQFSISSKKNKEKNKNIDKFNHEEKNYTKYKDKKKNILEIEKHFYTNINEKGRKKTHSSGKNNNYKKSIANHKKINEKKRRILNMSQIINISNKINNKKEKIIKPKIYNNVLVLQPNKTFVNNTKYKMNINKNDINKNNKIKKNESFDKKLTDDIKEKILKIRNPKINNKKQNINEAQLKLQLKIKRINKYKNILTNRKIGQKISIFNKERKKHTIIHNRNASATPNRYNKIKNNSHININYINNNININNIFFQKIREHTVSPEKKHIKNNSSLINYQKMNKIQPNILFDSKNTNYKNKNNISLINRKGTIEDNNNSTVNKSSKKINFKKKNIISRLSGHKINMKKLLKNIENKITCKSERNRNSSLTNRRKPKETPKSINFLSFLNNNNKSSVNKRINNHNNNNSYLNDSYLNNKNNLFHTSFNNYNNKLNNNKSIKTRQEKEKNKILINIKKNKIKKNIYKNEIKENCSFISRVNQLTNYISPVHKNNKNLLNISNNKKKNKNMINNISRAINHKKCSSMKFIDNNSNSLNYDMYYKKKYTINKSYEERKRKKEKSMEKKEGVLSCKSDNKRKLINLSFKSQNNKIKTNNNNYKSNYSLKRNIIFPKKYKGPIDFRNITMGNSGSDICDIIENIIKKKNINYHRINPYKIICWKNSEIIDINIYLLPGEIGNANKKGYINDINNSINILRLDTNDLEDNYSNTFNGFYTNKERNINLKKEFNNILKTNIYYINIFSQKERMNNNNNKTLFELINKLIFNNCSLVKMNKK